MNLDAPSKSPFERELLLFIATMLIPWYRHGNEILTLSPHWLQMLSDCAHWHLGCFKVWAILNEAAIFACRFLVDISFLAPLGQYWGTQLLHHMVGVYLVLQESANLFSKLLAPFCTPTSNESLPIFASIWYCHCLDFVHSDRCEIHVLCVTKWTLCP